MSEEQKQLIREKAIEFDIKQRLFLNGKYHSTEFNKWFEQTLKEVLYFATKETERVTEERIVREISQTIEEYRCFPDEVHCTCLQAFKEKHLEEKCGCGSPESHQLYKENKCPVKVINLIRNK